MKCKSIFFVSLIRSSPREQKRGTLKKKSDGLKLHNFFSTILNLGHFFCGFNFLPGCFYWQSPESGTESRGLHWDSLFPGSCLSEQALSALLWLVRQLYTATVDSQLILPSPEPQNPINPNFLELTAQFFSSEKIIKYEMKWHKIYSS